MLKLKDKDGDKDKNKNNKLMPVHKLLEKYKIICTKIEAFQKY